MQDILAKYDNPEMKGFSYSDVGGELVNLSQDVPDIDKVRYEVLAMSFSDFRTDIDQITPAHIAYWEKRAAETKNPLMQMRYLRLVNDFKKAITNQEPDYRTIKLGYIESILKVIDGEYCSHTMWYFMFIERAIERACALHNEPLINRTKEVLFRLHNRYKDDLDKPGRWGVIMRMLLQHRDIFTDAEQQTILQENEDRYNQLYDLCKQHGAETDRYVHILRDETQLLCDYYDKNNETEKIRTCISGLVETIHISSQVRGAMWHQGMLEQMQALYRKHHLYKEASHLYVDIQKLGSEVLKELQLFETSATISQETINQIKASTLAGTPEEVMTRFIKRNIPDQAQEKQRQMMESQETPLISLLLATTNLDMHGMPQSKIGIGDDGERSRFINEMWKNIWNNSFMLRIQINAMKEANILTLETVKQAFENTPYIIDGHREIFERGVNAYFEGDYLVACHLLIPQFEAMIRQIVHMKGGEILRSSGDANNGDEYKALEGLLSSDTIKGVFTDDEITYFKTLFTEKAGANLRNELSHGLMPIGHFNSAIADRVMHALMAISAVK